MFDAPFDAFAYPVSALMKLWHDLLSLPLDPASGLAWVSSIVLLVCTVRLLLLRPTWSQLRSGRRMAVLRPQLAELKKKHPDDHLAYATAARQVQKDAGVSAVGCLPVLLQLPVFIGLYHLLAGFTSPDGAGTNGVFGPDQVLSFAHATVFGVPLSAAIRTSADVLQALQPGLVLSQVLVVAVPLLVIAATATFVNVWASARRQAALPATDDGPLGDVAGRLTRMMIWVAPLSVLVGGLFFPVPLALIVYWAVNGTWTTVSTLLMNRRLDRLVVPT